jgi:hypothetical protein
MVAELITEGIIWSKLNIYLVNLKTYFWEMWRYLVKFCKFWLPVRISALPISVLEGVFLPNCICCQWGWIDKPLLIVAYLSYEEFRAFLGDIGLPKRIRVI